MITILSFDASSIAGFKFHARTIFIFVAALFAFAHGYSSRCCLYRFKTNVCIGATWFFSNVVRVGSAHGDATTTQFVATTARAVGVGQGTVGGRARGWSLEKREVLKCWLK